MISLEINSRGRHPCAAVGCRPLHHRHHCDHDLRPYLAYILWMRVPVVEKENIFTYFCSYRFLEILLRSQVSWYRSACSHNVVAIHLVKAAANKFWPSAAVPYLENKLFIDEDLDLKIISLRWATVWVVRYTGCCFKYPIRYIGPVSPWPSLTLATHIGGITNRVSGFIRWPKCNILFRIIRLTVFLLYRGCIINFLLKIDYF